MNTTTQSPQESWPKTTEEFEKLMQDIDDELDAVGVRLPGRPIRMLSELSGRLECDVPFSAPKQLVEAPGFATIDVLVAKAIHWYDEQYGEKLKLEMVFSYFPVKLGNAVFRVRTSVRYGRTTLFVHRDLDRRGKAIGMNGQPAELNMLREVQGLTQAFANKLSDQALQDFAATYHLATVSFEWRDRTLRGILFNQAVADFDQCCDAILASHFGNARYAASQAIEKTLKGVIDLLGGVFPKSAKLGHDLVYLGDLLRTDYGINVPDKDLCLANAPSNVRYEVGSTESQALIASYVVITTLDALRRSPVVGQALAKAGPVRGIR